MTFSRCLPLFRGSRPRRTNPGGQPMSGETMSVLGHDASGHVSWGPQRWEKAGQSNWRRGTQATLISQRTQRITLLVGVCLCVCLCVCFHIYRKIWSSYFTWLYDKVLFPVSYCLHAWTVPLWPQTKENMCLPTSAVKSPGRNPSRQKFRRKWWLPCCSGTSLFTPKLLSNKWRFTTAEHELDRLFKWWAQRTSTAVT
jgi:hypothetical protein